MRKLFAVLFAFLLIAGSVCAQDAEPASYEITERAYPFYDGSVEEELNEPFPLYFMNGVDDLPYVELESWMELMIFLNREWLEDPKYDLMFSAEGKDAAYVRENEYHMQFDFEEDTILFDDYNAFLHTSSEGSLLDLLSASGFTEAGESELFQRNLNYSYDRYGDAGWEILYAAPDHERCFDLSAAPRCDPFQRGLPDDRQPQDARNGQKRPDGARRTVL